jgi:glucose-1-phosphate thymidylyltransferase
MKALILSGGKGTRLRPLTHSGAKQLVPVANKPILWYSIESIVAAGITDIGIIVSPETGTEVEAVTGNGDRFGATITYILQAKPNGLAHAVQTARSFLGDEPFVMYLGDNLIQGALDSFLGYFDQAGLDGLILLCEVPNPSAFGVAIVNEAGKVERLIEKPAQPPSNLALVGIYFFSPMIHKIIETLAPSARGEYEITDAIQGLIDDGRPVEAKRLTGWWLDTGKKDDLLEANRIVLEEMKSMTIAGTIDASSQIIGRVQVGKGSDVKGCTIRGPVIIGENCRLENCFIGPYSSVADRVVLQDMEMEHSVILCEAQVTEVDRRIVDTVIGRRAKLMGGLRRPKALRMIVGDDCQIELD